MLLQLSSIGNQKIKYKNHEDLEFASLKEYLLLAQKTISKFSRQFYKGLGVKMLKDEEAISSVANSMMMADWRWDKDYENKQGTKKNKYSYRNQCALWAIQTYLSKDYKMNQTQTKTFSLDQDSTSQETINIHELTADLKVCCPEEYLIQQEEAEALKKTIEELLSLDCLSARQKDYIRLYYFEGQTFKKISEKYNITREAVRQGLNKAISIIRQGLSTND